MDPKDRAIVSIPAPERLAGSGWTAEAHGVWLLVHRQEPQETTAENIGSVVDEAIDVARRGLAVGGMR